MRIALLTSVVLFVTAGCNRSQPQRPDAERVIRDTVAQSVFKTLGPPETMPAEPIVVNTGQQETIRQQQADILHLLARLGTTTQTFTINASENTDVTAQHGTILHFTQGCFEDQAGKTATGLVKVEVKECYNRGELLAENLNLITNNDPINSKAAIYIAASQQGEKLTLKSTERIGVQFPFSLPKQGHRFYTTGSATATWQPYRERPTDKLRFKQPDFNYNGLSLQAYLDKTIHYPEYARANELSTKVEATLHVEADGSTTVTDVVSDYVIFKEEVSNRLKNMPKWVAAKYGERAIASTVKIRFDFNLRRAEQMKATLDPGEITYLPFENGDKANSTYKSENTFLFDQTGWLCYGSPVIQQSPTADIIVRANAHTDVRILLNGSNSIVHAQNYLGYARNRQLWVNQPVVVLAIRREGNHTFYSMQPLVLKEQNVVDPAWKQTTEAELQQLLTHIARSKTLS